MTPKSSSTRDQLITALRKVLPAKGVVPKSLQSEEGKIAASNISGLIGGYLVGYRRGRRKRRS